MSTIRFSSPYNCYEPTFSSPLTSKANARAIFFLTFVQHIALGYYCSCCYSNKRRFVTKMLPAFYFTKKAVVNCQKRCQVCEHALFWSNIIFRIQGTKTSLKGSHDVISLWRVTSIDKIPEVTKTKVSKTKRYSLSKLRLVHALLKQLIQTLPHMSRSRSGKICITLPKCMRDERRRSYYSGFSVVLETLWKRNYFVWDTKEDTTRNQWLWCIYNTVPEQNTNTGVCTAHFTENGLIKDCFYKVEQFQLYKFLTHSL